MTLVEFLRARADEAEDAAKRVHQPYRLYACDDGHLEEPMRVNDLYGEHDGEYEQWADGDDRLPNHHNSWALIYDPARVLAEVEAKRAIMDMCTGMLDTAGPQAYGLALAVLDWLALPYADHPDYDPSWRP